MVTLERAVRIRHSSPYRNNFEERPERSGNPTDPAYVGVRFHRKGIDVTGQNGAVHEVFLPPNLKDFDVVEFVTSTFGGPRHLAAVGVSDLVDNRRRHGINRGFTKHGIKSHQINTEGAHLDSTEIAHAVETAHSGRPSEGTTMLNSSIEELDRQEYPLDIVFAKARGLRTKMEQSGRIVSRQEALGLAFSKLTKKEVVSFLASSEQRETNKNLAIPPLIDALKLFKYVANNADIPEQDRYDSGRENPYYARLQQTLQTHAERTPEHGESSLPYIGAIEALAIIWEYQDQLPAEERAAREHAIEKWLDTQAAGMQGVTDHIMDDRTAIRVQAERIVDMRGADAFIGDKQIQNPAGVIYQVH